MQEHLPGIPVERWVPCPGFDRYEVSDAGRVRRVPRILHVVNGSERHLAQICLRGRLQQGRLLVSLDAGNGTRKIRGVARLVLMAFLGDAGDAWVASAVHPATPTLRTVSWRRR